MPHEWIPGLAQPFGLLLTEGDAAAAASPGLNLAKFESGVLLQWSESCLGVQSQLCENLADTLESSLFGCMPKQAESFSHLHPVQFSFGDARLGLRSKALGCAFYDTDVG